MSLKNSFREIAIQQSDKQEVLVDALTEESRILEQIPMEATSNGIQNVYEEQGAITSADQVEFDAPLPAMDSTTELKKIDLSTYGGIIEVGEDTVQQFGGLDVYLSKKLPAILRDTGNKLEYSIFYNNMRASAAGFSKLVSAGGAGSTNYSIMCVKWTPGEVTGLFDPSGFGQGKTFFDMEMISGGNLYKDSNGILVYGMRIKTYMGMQIANPRYISGIVNCDITNDDLTGTRTFPTEQALDKMIIDARANPANTVIYCRPEVKSYMNNYKAFRMEMMPDMYGVDRRVDTWNGIPIVTSYNLAAGNEPVVTL